MSGRTSCRDSDVWVLELCDWVIQDGGYPDLQVGSHVESPVELWEPTLHARAAGSPAGASRLRGDSYRVSGELRTHDGITVLDLGGVRAFSTYVGPGIDPAVQTQGTWLPVEGTVRLGLDHLHGDPRSVSWPPLAYDWEVVGIDLDTTPWVPDPRWPVTSGRTRSWVRDRDRFRSRPVERTDLAAHETDGTASYFLSCRLLDPEPRHSCDREAHE